MAVVPVSDKPTDSLLHFLQRSAVMSSDCLFFGQDPLLPRDPEPCGSLTDASEVSTARKLNALRELCAAISWSDRRPAPFPPLPRSTFCHTASGAASRSRRQGVHQLTGAHSVFRTTLCV